MADYCGGVATRLPLFPLSAVLVPGLVMPLHIFEPRYRVLVQALMDLPDGAPRHFGVIATRVGQDSDTASGVYGVGCTAELREVTPYDDGRFDVVTVGHLRFRLRGLDDEAGTPYQTGMVDFLDEEDGKDDAELQGLAELVALRFAAYRDRLRVEQSGVPTDPRVLSYLVAAAAVLELPERQRLLEAATTSDRLQEELVLLRREIGLVDAFRALPAVDLLRQPRAPN
jgi:Lon protease-like protein